MTQVAWLTDDQIEDWKAVTALIAHLPSQLDAQLKADAGLNVFEYHVLVALSEAPEGLAMGQLARLAWGSPSRLTHAVSRLERAGWVERRGERGAGRRATAHLTEDGRAKLVAAAPGHVTEARRLVVDALSADELATLGALARRINDRIEGPPTSG